MALKIKICGLSTEAAVDAALDSGADMIGFNFFPKSPRFVTPQRAAELARLIRGKAEIVALTVDATDESLKEIVDLVAPEWLQFHGRESRLQVHGFVHRFDMPPVMKVVGVSGPEDIVAARAYASVCPLMLLDAKPPKDAAYPGGHGKTFDWDLLSNWPSAFMLAGGLNDSNVADAIKRLRGLDVPLFGVDVASGVEAAPGVKDASKITRFVAAARAADRENPGIFTEAEVKNRRFMWRTTPNT